MIKFPEDMSAEAFLNHYWQKAPLFMPQALPADLPELNADELGWLATLDDVESRLIFSEREGDNTNYRVEHGPFDEKTLSVLPAEDWTLLVQDVEKHLPDFRRYILEASFIPDWRVDDLMVSFAAPGGSVGPHRDNYDVFLCQGAGQREWRIPPANAKLETVESGELSLLEPFADVRPQTARSKDVLYLPPGIAHWGVANESGMTYSIGMRAPALSEFLAGVSRIHHCDIDHDRGDETFYCDPDLTASEAEPGLISDRAIERARNSFATEINILGEDVALVFGSVVTDVKAWLSPEAPSKSQVDQFLASTSPEIRVHGMARLAYYTGGDKGLVFVNGHGKSVSTEQLKYFRRLCANRVVSATDDELFQWLLAHGAFCLEPDAQNYAT